MCEKSDEKYQCFSEEMASLGPIKFWMLQWEDFVDTLSLRSRQSLMR